MASKPQGNLLGRNFSGQNRKVNIQELTAEKNDYVYSGFAVGKESNR